VGQRLVWSALSWLFLAVAEAEACGFEGGWGRVFTEGQSRKTTEGTTFPSNRWKNRFRGKK
jgi:hypothetical protein